MPVIHLPIGWTVALDIAVWAIAGTAIGYAMHRAPIERFDADNVLTRLRPFERDGRFYERRLHIKRWKRGLPEAGTVFGDGFDKRRLHATDEAGLRRFVAETRRAEMTHWFVFAISPFFVLVNPWPLAVVMVVYAIVANLPCTLVQRYNRARLMRVLTRAVRAKKA